MLNLVAWPICLSFGGSVSCIPGDQLNSVKRVIWMLQHNKTAIADYGVSEPQVYQDGLLDYHWEFVVGVWLDYKTHHDTQECHHAH